MSNRLNRRDFLKLAGSLPLSLTLPPLARTFRPLQPLQEAGKNVLIIVFDAFSAYHLPIYGYARNTTPNIARLAERAIVYHNHYAGGNFTTPGTASLLTGTLPWLHRAFQHYGTVTEAFVDQNIFQAFQNHYRVAYSHNPLANVLLKQFSGHLNEYVPMSKLMLTTDGFLETLFANDEDIASVAWTRTAKKQEEGLEGHSYSLFFSEFYQPYQEKKITSFKPLFPRGVPNIKGDNFFLLEHAVDWLQEQINQFPRPFMGYFHFMPPHAPCNTHKDFYKAFAKDGFQAPAKPEDIFSDGNSYEELLRRRLSYDEFILYLDREFARLFDSLESSGVLEDTWVVLTADHGELFERGVRGHTSPLLYQPVVRIPLVIFEPGRSSRRDVYAATSAVDLLPTLLHVTGEKPAGWTEGTILPPFSVTQAQPDRPVYTLNAKSNDPAAPLTHATAMMVSGKHKLTYFFGYKELGQGVERVELYDIEADPEELNDLYAEQKDTGANLLAQLKEKLKEVNQPYI
jgi:arylsulfatase A-like enzyme